MNTSVQNQKTSHTGDPDSSTQILHFVWSLKIDLPYSTLFREMCKGNSDKPVHAVIRFLQWISVSVSVKWWRMCDSRFRLGVNRVAVTRRWRRGDFFCCCYTLVLEAEDNLRHKYSPGQSTIGGCKLLLYNHGRSSACQSESVLSLLSFETLCKRKGEKSHHVCSSRETICACL